MYSFSIILLVAMPILAISMILLINQETLLLNPQFSLNVHYTSIWTAFIVLLLVGFIIFAFDFEVALFQFIETKFIFWGMPYKLGIDGLSLFFIVLFAVLFLVAMLVISQDDPIEVYNACLLLLVMQTTCMLLLISINLLAILFFLGTSMFCLYILLSSKDIEISSNDLWHMFSLLIAADILVWVVIGYIYNQTGLLNLDELVLYEFSEQEKLFLFSGFFVASLIHLGVLPQYKSWVYLCKKKIAIILCLMIVNAMIYLMCRVVVSLLPMSTNNIIVSYIVISLLFISITNNISVAHSFLQKLVFNHIPLIILGVLLGKNGIVGSMFYLVGYNIIHLSLIIFSYAPYYSTQYFQVAWSAILGVPSGFIVSDTKNENVSTVSSESNQNMFIGLSTDSCFYQRTVLIVLMSLVLGFIPNAYLIGHLIILQSLFEVSGLMFALGMIISLSIFINNVLLYQYLLYQKLSKLELCLVVFLLCLTIILGLLPNIIIDFLDHSFFLRLD